MMARETRLIEGEVPETLRHARDVTSIYAIAPDQFLLRLPGMAFHYVRGRGITYSRAHETPRTEVELFLNGSVYGAVAYLNGLIPLHASAVVHEGRAYAITAPSGHGKSTLAAALSQEGFGSLADDVLVLDLSDGAQISCVPGHAKMKLWQDALDVLGLVGDTRVRCGEDKYFVNSSGQGPAVTIPLGGLFVISETTTDQCVINPERGARRGHKVLEALYRFRFASAILGARGIFATVSRITEEVPIFDFGRPRKMELFPAGVGLVARKIRDTPNLSQARH